MTEKCGANKQFSPHPGRILRRIGLEAAPKNRVMNSANLAVSESAARRVNKAKRKPRGRPRTSAARKTSASATPDLPSAGTLARTKTLLLAALRVWELKHRVAE